jgi:hypothetical protein
MAMAMAMAAAPSSVGEEAASLQVRGKVSSLFAQISHHKQLRAVQVPNESKK